MPRYNPSDEDLESLSDSSASTKPDASPDTTEMTEKPEKADEESMAPTAIVDMKVLQSGEGEAIKEGDEIVVRVVKVHGEEAEIEYAPKESGDESEDGGMTSDDELDSMNKTEY